MSAKDVIHTHGEDLVVPVEEARAFRGVHWALWSIGAFVLISAIVFFLFFTKAASDGEVQSPSSIANSNSR